jgi:tRNA pseudouridine55 synthase
LGQAADCGAHVVALRREKIGEFDVKDAWQVDDLVAFIKRFSGSE